MILDQKNNNFSTSPHFTFAINPHIYGKNKHPPHQHLHQWQRSRSHRKKYSLGDEQAHQRAKQNRSPLFYLFGDFLIENTIIANPVAPNIEPITGKSFIISIYDSINPIAAIIKTKNIDIKLFE